MIIGCVQKSPEESMQSNCLQARAGHGGLGE